MLGKLWGLGSWGQGRKFSHVKPPHFTMLGPSWPPIPFPATLPVFSISSSPCPPVMQCLHGVAHPTPLTQLRGPGTSTPRHLSYLRGPGHLLGVTPRPTGVHPVPSWNEPIHTGTAVTYVLPVLSLKSPTAHPSGSVSSLALCHLFSKCGSDPVASPHPCP